MRKTLFGIGVIAFLLMGLGIANASLVTIGTATYGGSAYNLIWDGDNGNSVIWLDYTNSAADWSTQMAWATGLGGQLTNINTPGYNITWVDQIWRLPTTVDGRYVWGHDGTTTAGCNIVTSEMGHLFYDELNNKGYCATDGTSPQSGWGLNNTGDFNNLHTDWSWYWSSTDHADSPGLAWVFNMNYGSQDVSVKLSSNRGLAVRSARVSAVPIPGALWILGSGLFGLVAVRRRKKN